jgi:tetratricopeptide (TPR) repeat protein
MYLTPTIVHLGEARLLANQTEDAHALAGRALALAREHGQRSQEAWSLRLMGETEARDPSNLDRAAAHYREAMTISRTLDLRPLIAHCHFGLGKRARLAGDRNEARDDLAMATKLWRDMDVRFWFEQAEAALLQLA